MQNILNKVEKGFNQLDVDKKYQDKALENLRKWINSEQFKEYKPQILYIIETSEWDYLLDCFYQVIPFGTGGRRGEVGIGPNRINKWTIQASAQGHSQYLINKYGNNAKKRGIVLCYGIRHFYTNKYFNDKLPNPVRDLTGEDLANAAAEVYIANGLKTYKFKGPRTTPELSFAIRYLDAVAGDMFDASHNPPEHNGKKVYDDTGGQLIPPFDENLVNEVTKKVEKIKTEVKYESNVLFNLIGKEVDDHYIEKVAELHLTNEREISIVFTPLHGVGTTSVVSVLEKVGFKVDIDPKTKNQSGKFENVTFNIPNPEVIQSFDTTLKYAKKKKADILLNSDPDADRIGVMINDGNKWKYLNGNEIGSILTRFVIEKKGKNLKRNGIVIKTLVTTNLAKQICELTGTKIIPDLPVGFKYIGDEMNKLEKKGEIDLFLFGLEESHGYIAGNYVRDKDAAIGALWLAELAALLKKKGNNVVDYLNKTYDKYGYYRNYLTEIRLPGAEGMGKIRKIQDTLRQNKPKAFGDFKVDKIEDLWDRKPIVSQTDKVSKDVLVFYLKTFKKLSTLKVTVRPSGTEPKIKMYFEIGNQPGGDLEKVKIETEELLKEIEKKFMQHCYKLIGVDFPDRGFLLFWQLPLKDKLKYFEIEKEIVNLNKVKNKKERRDKLNGLIGFLGTNPIQKIDQAFSAKHGKGLEAFLSL